MVELQGSAETGVAIVSTQPNKVGHNTLPSLCYQLQIFARTADEEEEEGGGVRCQEQMSSVG